MMARIAWTVTPVAASGYMEYVLWFVALMAAILVLGVALAVFRKKLRSTGLDPRHTAGFSMEALEAMRRSGQIDDAEFKAMRRTALGLDVGGEADDNAASSNGGGVAMNEESGEQTPPAGREQA